MRIALVWPVANALVEENYGLALVLFVVAAVSDGLDGYLAKRFGWTSQLGKVIDPLADKLLLVTVFITAAWHNLVPWWIAAAAISRDVMIGLGALIFRLWFGPLKGRPTIMSKINTLFQLGYIAAVMLVAGGRHPAARHCRCAGVHHVRHHRAVRRGLSLPVHQACVGSAAWACGGVSGRRSSPLGCVSCSSFPRRSHPGSRGLRYLSSRSERAGRGSSGARGRRSSLGDLMDLRAARHRQDASVAGGVRAGERERAGGVLPDARAGEPGHRRARRVTRSSSVSASTMSMRSLASASGSGRSSSSFAICRSAARGW